MKSAEQNLGGDAEFEARAIGKLTEELVIVCPVTDRVGRKRRRVLFLILRVKR